MRSPVSARLFRGRFAAVPKLLIVSGLLSAVPPVADRLSATPKPRASTRGIRALSSVISAIYSAAGNISTSYRHNVVKILPKACHDNVDYLLDVGRALGVLSKHHDTLVSCPRRLAEPSWFWHTHEKSRSCKREERSPYGNLRDPAH
jgi:hypothetical protein